MVSKWVIAYLYLGYIGIATHLITNLLLASWDIQVGKKFPNQNFWDTQKLPPNTKR